MTRSGRRPTGPQPGPPPRPPSIDIAAAVLVFGGLFGISQMLVGDFVITGSLPAKEPILGVALILYVASAGLGLVIRTGRAWLAAVNLAGAFAILYLLALDRLVHAVLGLAYMLAFVILLRFREWFRDVSRATGDRQG